jgi:hypothetical protein
VIRWIENLSGGINARQKLVASNRFVCLCLMCIHHLESVQRWRGGDQLGHGLQMKSAPVHALQMGTEGGKKPFQARLGASAIALSLSCFIYSCLLSLRYTRALSHAVSPCVHGPRLSISFLAATGEERVLLQVCPVHGALCVRVCTGARVRVTRCLHVRVRERSLSSLTPRELSGSVTNDVIPVGRVVVMVRVTGRASGRALSRRCTSETKDALRGREDREGGALPTAHIGSRDVGCRLPDTHSHSLTRSAHERVLSGRFFGKFGGAHLYSQPPRPVQRIALARARAASAARAHARRMTRTLLSVCLNVRYALPAHARDATPSQQPHNRVRPQCVKARARARGRKAADRMRVRTTEGLSVQA